MPPKLATKKAPPKPNEVDIVSIGDLLLPRSLIAKITKSVLPEKGAVQREAVTAIQEAATVFVSYIAAAANDRARQSGHKAINAKDLLETLEHLEYGDFVPRLAVELEKAEVVTSSSAKRRKGRSAVDDGAQPKEASHLEEVTGPTPKRPRGDDTQATVAGSNGDTREAYEPDDIEEVDDDDFEEILGLSGDEDADEDDGEMGPVADNLSSDHEHVTIEDEATDVSDSD